MRHIFALYVVAINTKKSITIVESNRTYMYLRLPRSAKSKKLSETTVLLYVIVIATCEGAKSHTTLGFQSRGEKI